jgi:PE family
MSFVTAATEFVEAAAHDLAGLGSSIGEATSVAAAPTTGIAAAGADEVSSMIAALFGSHASEFQAIAARASTFHEQFVKLLSSGANSYLTTEVANASQTLANTVSAPAQSLFGGAGSLPAAAQQISSAVTAFEHGGAASLFASAPTGLSQFAATVAAPYQTLISTTSANLHSIESTFAANPFPVVHQILNNQVGYAQTLATELQTGIQNFPTELANLPATIQNDLQGLLSINPAALAQHFVNNQIGYAQTIVNGLGSAAHDFTTGVQGLPAALQTGFQDALAGNLHGAGVAVGQGLENVLLPGFHDVIFNLADPPSLLPIIPLGPLGDLAPIFNIPGQMLQNFTNLLPAGSIPAQIAQHTTNLLNVVTDLGSSLNSGTLGINFGLPLQFVFGLAGAPVNGLVALHSSASAFMGAVQTGNIGGAAAALLDSPAVFANGFLNGTTTFSLPPLTTLVDLGIPGLPPSPLTAIAELPLGGLLTPLTGINSNIGPLPGTPIGGLIPTLLGFGSQLADALG